MGGLDQARYLLSEVDPLRLPPADAEIAFVGRSNVGKSTLLNALCRKDLARVSSTPGRTRAINVFEAGRGRHLVDLPGYGFAEGAAKEVASWGPMIEGYLKRREALKMVFALVDAKVGPTRLDSQMLRWLQARGLPWRVVATKVDQVKPSRAAVRRRELADEIGVAADRIAWVSADQDLGMRELRLEAAALLG